LEEVKKTLPKGVEVAVAYERTSLVDKVLHTVEKNLFEGAILVIAVIFVFLGNLRAGLIVALAIPLSMLFAFDLMLRFGIAGSLMSLGAIDFGLIVDSSVIMIENAERRLAEDESGRSIIDVVRDAAVEVRKPTMFGELIIMIVYLPILALEGVEGKLFRPMALTVIFCLLGSMVMSLTLMPVLASYSLKRRKSAHEPRIVRKLKELYRPVLAFALNRRKAVIAMALGCLAVAGVLATRLGSEFVPRLMEGSVVINTVRLASVSLDESVRYGSHLERTLLEKFPAEIERVWTRTGSAEIATDPMGVELSDIFITLKSRNQWIKAHTQGELAAVMEKELKNMPGMRMIFTQPIEMRVNEMIAGIRSDVGIKIFGDDFEVLKAKAKDVEKVVKNVSGAADVSVEQVSGQPLLRVEVDRNATARYGIPAREVLEVIEALGGRDVGMLQEGDRRFPVAVRIADRFRVDPEDLGRILVTAGSGERIPLSLLTKIIRTEGPSTINREWGKRRVVVQTNVRGRDVGSFVADVRKAVEREVKLPEGYFVRYGGQFENLQRARLRLLIVVPVALALIFTLLYFTYGRIKDAARVFTGVPFAAVGGIMALWLRGIPFSISAGVGFVALSGVAVLGDMVLVSAVRDLLAKGIPLIEAIKQAAEQRFRPVLMTALVASFGFIPMAFNTGIGAEVQRPLATVVIGGVVSSTVLTLLVLPVLYAVFGSAAARENEEPAVQTDNWPELR
jgi:cobalt-zinc-cadmium resistance protein CzcA